ncbi:MAG TPA: hypothetical protein VJ997_04280 [Longimicrobiales bacterium]|nr:hypothetical protein [Longimicrobiales bacterium]
MSRGGEAPAPLLSAAPPGRSRGAPAALVSVSASLAGGLGRGRGPELRFSDPRAFAQVKRSHAWLRDFLDWAREATSLREAFVWNTCQRVEFYGWLPGPPNGPEGTRLLARIRKELFGAEPDGLEVNVLDGPDARHHLLRTACGLNSDFPGDRDVVAQLETACRRARGAGTAGALSWELVSNAVALARDVTTHTDFGRFATGYCAAALARIREAGDRDLGVLRHVVIGGSTTSRSVLCALRSQHGVQEHQLTSVYRDHHGQMKQLRAAVGNGRRLRVHAYSEECVLRAVADADVVFFGIDQSEPVIDAGVLDGLRDYTERPLIVVDFNTFGSLAAPPAHPGITTWTAQTLDHEVAMHAAITTTREGFGAAVEEAEAWIEAKLTGSGTLHGRPAAV